MADERDTWPAPPAGMSMDDLSPQRLGLLMNQKMDVMGRELMQVRKQIKTIEANLETTMNEVRRHGRCIAPAVLAEPLEDLAHD
ncbi:MAG: hypothetical protein A2Z03_11065 [Chloroflexi bacterium RBG_16_56_8]|nr:MAG: hypothetical protein A2Z03_11065 [Chloroflexi bacterium RBG_16_56_8]